MTAVERYGVHEHQLAARTVGELEEQMAMLARAGRLVDDLPHQPYRRPDGWIGVNVRILGDPPAPPSRRRHPWPLWAVAGLVLAALGWALVMVVSWIITHLWIVIGVIAAAVWLAPAAWRSRCTTVIQHWH